MTNLRHLLSHQEENYVILYWVVFFFCIHYNAFMMITFAQVRAHFDDW